MITLHVQKGGSDPRKLEEKLKELVVSYRITEHESSEIREAYIEEDGNEFRTGDEIRSWLEELQAELNFQRTLSGDGCYIKPDSDKHC